MKIVKFKNGKFGIRRGWFIYDYLSLNTKEGDYWWRADTDYIERYCQGSLEVIRNRLNHSSIKKKQVDKGTPVKQEELYGN